MIIDLYNFCGFALSSIDRGSKEQIAITSVAILNDLPYRMFQKTEDIPSNWIPCGSVEWCEDYLGRKFVPDYYPVFLEKYLHRKVWKSNKWPLGERVFIKPSDRYKRFTGFITDSECCKKEEPPYWCSEVIGFVNEWRYYVANGKILTVEWYGGDEINTPLPPDSNIDWPRDYCGAVDFGMTVDNKMILVEANHPFACGWYGKDHKKYVEWIIEGWKYLINLP